MERSFFSESTDPFPLVVPLRADAFDNARNLLAGDTASNLFLLSWLENYGVASPGRPELFSWYGVKKQDRLTAISLVINKRLLLLFAPDPQDAQVLGSYFCTQTFQFDHIVSESTTVNAFWSAYQRRTGEARLHRDQAFLKLSPAMFSQPADSDCALRVAELRDAEPVFLASALMHAEETLKDPLEKDPALFRRHIEQRVVAGRTFVWFDDHHRLVFKADISAQSGYGAQISGVYTPPSFRRKGIGTRGVESLCTLLFAQGFPLLTLYVNLDNASARRIYDRIGFTYHCDYHTVFVT